MRGDSQLVGKQLQGTWKVRNERMRVLCDRALLLLGRVRAWRFVRVPRSKVVQRLGH